MGDVECPYCGEEQEINHDDGYGYNEGEKHEQQCSDCEKNFIYETSISFYYEAERADCLNDSEHNYKLISQAAWPDWKRCVDCNHEIRGEYKEPTTAIT